MDWFADPGAWAGRLVFTRGIALVYLLAFVAALRQGPALIGTHGLTPVPRFLSYASWAKAPSLFFLDIPSRDSAAFDQFLGRTVRRNDPLRADLQQAEPDAREGC